MTSLQQAMDIAEERAFEKRTPSFPPVSDTIVWWKNLDKDELRQRARGGVNNCGLVLAVIGSKLNDLGLWLSRV
jgi:hypothetical protein